MRDSAKQGVAERLTVTKSAIYTSWGTDKQPGNCKTRGSICITDAELERRVLETKGKEKDVRTYKNGKSMQGQEER